MAAPALSHLICSMALVVLIFLMPVFYAFSMDSVTTQLTGRELTEIADYTSNALENLSYLANFTEAVPLNLTKQLLYLPSNVENSAFVLNITSSNGNALKVVAYLRDRQTISVESWLPPGLKVGSNTSIQSSTKLSLAGCYRNATGFYVWLGSVA